MSRWILLGALLLLTGCVPVTTPLADPAKADPDQRLIGKWSRENETDAVDMPVVKGNPRGLMRTVHNGRADDNRNAFWFFTTTVGKHTYMTVYIEPGGGLRFADFRTEGAFAKYTQAKEHCYFIFKYTLAGDRLLVDGGSDTGAKQVFEAAKIASESAVFQTPPGWLAKYLATTGPAKIFDGSNAQEYRRAK